MIFLVNSDAMFYLDCVHIEDIYFFHLLESIIKENKELFVQSFKDIYILCFHENIIWFNFKEKIYIF